MDTLPLLARKDFLHEVLTGFTQKSSSNHSKSNGPLPGTIYNKEL